MYCNNVLIQLFAARYNKPFIIESVYEEPTKIYYYYFYVCAIDTDYCLDRFFWATRFLFLFIFYFFRFCAVR